MRSPFSPKRPVEDETPPARRGKRTTQDMLAENKGPGVVVTTLRTLVGLAIALVIGAGIWFGAAALEGDDPTPLAPWNSQSAPSVEPDPLADQ